MVRILSKYAALYIWEPTINKSLKGENVYLSKVICIKRIKGYEFIAYFEVEPLSGTTKERFGQLNVSFDKHGGIIRNSLILWGSCGRSIIKSIKNETLIFDKRSEFDWIYSSEASSESE
jgi:hypothetical protein